MAWCCHDPVPWALWCLSCDPHTASRLEMVPEGGPCWFPCPAHGGTNRGIPALAKFGQSASCAAAFCSWNPAEGSPAHWRKGGSNGSCQLIPGSNGLGSGTEVCSTLCGPRCRSWFHIRQPRCWAFVCLPCGRMCTPPRPGPDLEETMLRTEP